MAFTSAGATNLAKIVDVALMAGSKLSILDKSSLALFNGSKTIQVPSYTLQGLGTGNGLSYVDGDIAVTYTNYTLGYARNRSFSVSAQDADESGFVNLASDVLSTFIRTKVVPELDAAWIAKLASGAGTTVSADLSSASGSLALLDDALAALRNNGVDESNCVIFVSEAFNSLLSKDDALTKYLNVGDINITMQNGLSINQKVKMYNGIPIISVPDARCYNSFTFNDGSTAGQTDGGFATTSGVSKKVNFVIADKSMVYGIKKNENMKIVTPDVNQSGDAWKIAYSVKHDLLVPTVNAKYGVYAHIAATAVA